MKESSEIAPWEFRKAFQAAMSPNVDLSNQSGTFLRLLPFPFLTTRCGRTSVRTMSRICRSAHSATRSPAHAETLNKTRFICELIDRFDRRFSSLRMADISELERIFEGSSLYGVCKCHSQMSEKVCGTGLAELAEIKMSCLGDEFGWWYFLENLGGICGK